MVPTIQPALHPGIVEAFDVVEYVGTCRGQGQVVPVLLRELQDFRVRFTDSGNATFNALEGAHDDLVLALVLAVFGLSRPEPVRELDVVWARR